MEITYKDLIKKAGFIIFEYAHRHHPIGYREGYEDALYDNAQLVGGIIYELFPEEYSEAEVWRAVRAAELKGILVQVSRKSPGEKASTHLRHPDHPDPPIELLGKNENYLRDKLES
jgi:hypothetical protein